MNRDSFMTVVEALKALSRALKKAEQAYVKFMEPDYIDLPEIMQEAQQAINGDYEQFIIHNT